MMLKEINSRLKKGQITEEQLQQITPLYILLDFDKDIFAKIVDAIGVEAIADKKQHFEWAIKACDDRVAKERYYKALDRLEEISREKRELDIIVENYRKKI